MNDVTPTSAERAKKPPGMVQAKAVGTSRFIQGGTAIIDDLKLPGMLYGDFTRSSMPLPVSRKSTHPKPKRAGVLGGC